MAGLKDKRGFIDKNRLDLSERKTVDFGFNVGVALNTSSPQPIGRLIG